VHPTPIIFPNGNKVEVAIRRNIKTRQFTLRLSTLDGRITLTAPKFASDYCIQDFIKKKMAWLTKNVALLPAVIPVKFGIKVPVNGFLCAIKPYDGNKTKIIGDNELYIPREKNVKIAVKEYLKGVAEKQFKYYTDLFSHDLKACYKKISLKDPRSRWGSCSADGSIMYSWRLAMSPDYVLSYVAAHEVAHLIHLDHSKAFWKQVEDLYGDYRKPRQWLKKNGVALHLYKLGS